MRVVVADDSVLLREGVVRVLEDDGFEVVGQAGEPLVRDAVGRAHQQAHLVAGHSSALGRGIGRAGVGKHEPGGGSLGQHRHRVRPTGSGKETSAAR